MTEPEDGFNPSSCTSAWMVRKTDTDSKKQKIPTENSNECGYGLLIIFQYPTVSAVGFPPTTLWKRGARGDFKIKKVYLKIPRCLCSGEFS
jgi:hypothetical protein